MAHSNDEITGFDFPPLNAMPSEFDMTLQQPLGDGSYNDNVEMFMDPQFWSMDLGNGPPNDEAAQNFHHFDVTALANSHENTANTPIFHPDLASPPSTLASPVASAKPTRFPDVKAEGTSKKANSVDVSTPEDDDDNLKVSAEEDKRRRNTAASARFRVKKKQREQQMEKTAKEMTEKVTVLEGRVKELEKENRLLKGLLTEKATGGRGKHAESSSSDEEPATKAKRVKTEAGAR